MEAERNKSNSNKFWFQLNYVLKPSTQIFMSEIVPWSLAVFVSLEPSFTKQVLMTIQICGFECWK